MTKTRPNQALSLARIFAEFERVTVSDKEANDELTQIGLDSDSLLRDGLDMVSKYVNLKTLPINRFSLPVAASDKKLESERDEIVRLLNKEKKPKE